ncbi:hypothetical protein V2J09_006691 [Rumex salicifolius]
MSNAMDMSLEDLIKKNKASKSSRGGRGGRAARPSSSAPGGPTRREFKRKGNRPAPYSADKVQAPDGTWGHEMFADQTAAYPAHAAGARPAGIETGTKLYISNLEYGVSNEDIKELFSEVGDLKRFGVHYDRSGRSKGTADVVYARRSDALAAVKRYNNVQLDGKPMKIDIVGTNMPTPATAAIAPVGLSANRSGPLRSGKARGRARGIGRGAGRGGRGRGGGGRGGSRDEKVSVDDLDADLEKYHSEAMQTN